MLSCKALCLNQRERRDNPVFQPCVANFSWDPLGNHNLVGSRQAKKQLGHIARRDRGYRVALFGCPRCFALRFGQTADAHNSQQLFARRCRVSRWLTLLVALNPEAEDR